MRYLVSEIEAQFRSAINHAGITYQGDVMADGKLHRFQVDGDKLGSKNGAYILHADGYCPAGYFEDFRQGIKMTWKFNSHGGRSQITVEERAQIARTQALRKQNELQRQDRVAKNAGTLWVNAELAPPSHPYLARKAIMSCGARIAPDGRLMIPLQDQNLVIRNLQFISADGEKRFMLGGQKHGCFFSIGEMTETIFIAEGFATAASIYICEQMLAIVAYDAGNLKPVAEITRALYPTATIIIAGDNDHSGVGQAKAEEAANACGGLISVPPNPGQDWNDYLSAFDAIAAKEAL
ncbi:MAG: toprim domain-containing protein [Methylobacter sp.]|jgi:putative DNA primase/helicase|nr:toprim domain-containing protein [Methylobacter sp.]